VNDASEPAALAPYEAIVNVARLQLELATAGDVGGLQSLADTWDRVAADAPPQPPAQAASLLAEAAALGERTRVALLGLHAAMRRDAGLAAQASRAARGYAPPVSLLPRVDRGA
jgi:hypothetical protein